MMSTTGHGVPDDAAEECEERKYGECENGCVYDGCRRGGYG